MQKESYAFNQQLTQRSRVPDIVGIILILSASWYLFASFLELIGISYDLNNNYLIELKYNANNAYNFSDFSDFSDFKTNTLNIIGLAGALWLFIIGRGLTQYKDWARKQLNYYVIFSQLNALFLFIITIKSFPTTEMSNTFSTVLLMFALSLFAEPLVTLILALFVNQPYSKNSLHSY